MNGLSVCSGIGGIELGIKLVCPSYRTVCYVEREAYNAACLVKRMEEGWLDKAPIWDDIATFDGKPWRGKVDLVTAGFPCQPFSCAGRRKREADPRHIWPDIARIIGECEPEYVFLENVHISAFRQPFDDLRRMGFTLAPPYAVTAAEMGAGHLRRRVFVLAYRSGSRRQQELRGTHGDTTQAVSRNASGQPKREPDDETLSFANIREARRDPIGSAWWASEPELERLVLRFPHRVERDRALGNAVVPIMAAKAFSELMRGCFRA